MMFLIDSIRAEVEPVPGNLGWYQLTGRDIARWTADRGHTYSEFVRMGCEVDLNAQLMGVHSFSPEVGVRDPRFNEENNPDIPSFFIYKEKGSGKTYMILGVNLAEYALFRFLCPHAEGADIDNEANPMSAYRIEPAKAVP